MFIEHIRDVNKGCISKSFNIRFKSEYGFCIIKNCVLMEKGSNKWISLPSNKVEKDGEVKYYPHVLFDDQENQKAFLKKAMDKLAEAVNAPKEHQGDLPF